MFEDAASRGATRAGEEADTLLLVQRLKAGDHRAFEPLMRRHNSLVFRIARAVLPSHADAEDCAQGVWVKVFRQIDGFEGRSSLASWIGKITYHVAIDMKRSTPRTEERLDAVEDHASPAPSPEQSVIGAQVLSRLEEAIARLTPTFREVFMLRDVSGVPVADVAEILGLSAENVRVRSHRAREELSRELSGVLACDSAFSFDGERCNRIVVNVHRALDIPLEAASHAPGGTPGA